MAITALPALDRTSATFKTDVDSFFGAKMPAFVTEANALQADVNSKQATASSAAATATTQAGNASTSATTAAASASTAATQAASAADQVALAAVQKTLAAASATSAASSAATATTQAANASTSATNAATSAAAAADVAASIAGGPVVSVNGMTGVVTGVATLAGVQTLTNKTFTGYTETTYALTGTVIDPANGSIQTKTLSANTTFTESIADGQSVLLGITAGSYTVTWPSVTWAKVGGSGTAPTLTSLGVNWVVLWQVGGVLRGAFLGTA